MKMIYCLLLGLISQTLIFGQCDIKENIRPDGSTMRYFNPKPVAKLADFEIGIGAYRNTTANADYVTITLLLKNMTVADLRGDLTIQTTSSESVVLKMVESKSLTMNGRKLSVAMYEINPGDYKILLTKPLKSIYFNIYWDTYGYTVTENKTILNKELACLSK